MGTNSAATGLTKRKLGCASGLPIRDALTPEVVERFWSFVDQRGPQRMGNQFHDTGASHA